MSTFDLLYDYEKALQRTNRNQFEINSLRILVESCAAIPQTITDKQLLCFLSACDGIEDSVNVLKIYYEIKRNVPEIFKNRDPLSAEIQQCLENQYFLEFSKTPEGLVVYYYALQNSNSSNLVLNESYKTFFMGLDFSLCSYGPQRGITVILDMKNYKMSHVPKFTLRIVRSFMKYVQEALPAKLEVIHIFNISAVFKIILALMRPFISSNLFEKIIPHSSSMDYEKFYKEHIPKSCLPSDFGGDLESLDEMQKKQNTDFIKLRSYFLHEEEQSQ